MGAAQQTSDQEQPCKSSLRPSLARPSPSRSSRPTPLTTSRPRSRTRRASRPTSSASSSRASSSRTAARSRTTTSRRSRPSTWCSACAVAWRCSPTRAFDKALADAGDKLVVVDFTATWCGPCQRIAPVFQKLAEEMPDVVFVKVDVDENEETAGECGIQAMPTFQYYKNGE